VNRWSTRTLITVAALAASQAVIAIALAPLTAIAAAVHPALYALLAPALSLAVMIGVWRRMPPGTITLIGVMAGLLAMPFQAAGILSVLAFALPAAASDVALRVHPPGRAGSRWSAIVVGQVVAFAQGLIVFSLEDLVWWTLLAAAMARAVSAFVIALAARRAASLLGDRDRHAVDTEL
jgi:hypothetical protein